MGMFLKHLRRRGRTSSVGGRLMCPACGTTDKLRYLRSEGRDTDVYICKHRVREFDLDYVCNQVIRYVTTPFDPIGHGMDEKDSKEDLNKGIGYRDRNKIEKVKRARKRKINWMPGLGMLQSRRKK